MPKSPIIKGDKRQIGKYRLSPLIMSKLPIIKGDKRHFKSTAYPP